MINLLLGPSGGGKSFEAVVFHILPALRKGRKVITNLPLILEEIGKLNPKYLELISLRQNMVSVEVDKNSWNPFHRVWDKHKIKTVHHPFANISDYGDTWRHPVNGSGPLYVIDECHKPLPAKKTSLEVEEWFAEHRHEFADVLLITQSAGKVSQAVLGNLQVVYRVKKATAFGSNDAYFRKVQDGLKGDVVNETMRKYKPEFFKFYKSHTRSDGAGSELAALDIVPFWKRWPVIGAGVCFVGVLALIFSGHSLNPMKSVQASTLPVSVVHPVSAVDLAAGLASRPAVISVAASGVSSLPKPLLSAKKAHPFDGLTLHIVAYLESSTRWQYTFSVDQNGQPSFNLTQANLIKSGYTLERLSECSAKIHYPETGFSFYAVCDNSSVGIARSLIGNGS